MHIGVRLKAFILLPAFAALIAGGVVKKAQPSTPRRRSLRSGGVGCFGAQWQGVSL